MCAQNSQNTPSSENPAPSENRVTLPMLIAVVVAALGYFVDVFDLWLFTAFRVQSLQELGLQGDELTTKGALLLNCQQAGFLLGGFLWGILGDKRGRVSVMFGSILLYSVANIANAFVYDVNTYAILRFISGVGLAGEIGAGITLVSELLPRTVRGYGTTFVATLGVAGAIGAALAAKFLDWRVAFFVGGIMGLCLLGLRLAVHESGMFRSLSKETTLKRGSLKLLFAKKERTFRFLFCIFLAVPVYAVFGLLVTFSPEVSSSLGIAGGIHPADALLWAAFGITGGDLFSGLLSQWLKSRRAALFLFVSAGLAGVLVLSCGFISTAQGYLNMVGYLGVCVGFWACAITTTAEQFGTNLRATVTTTVPNLVRATGIPLTISFIALKPILGAGFAAISLSILAFLISLFAIWKLRETYGRDLNFFEE